MSARQPLERGPDADAAFMATSGRIDGRAFRDADQAMLAQQSARHDAALARTRTAFGPGRDPEADRPDQEDT